MTTGFGVSIGAVNSVWATVSGESDLPAVRVRRTAVTFDSAGGARIGGLPRFAPGVTDFADLTREFEPVVVGGRIWTSADLVAAVAICLIGTAESEGEPVITYPACYSESQVAALRHALDWAGATGTVLMPEPVAAVEWLDAEYGVAAHGLTLVYDLGGNSLDIAVVRTEADRDIRGVLGKPVRSYEYGGRPLGTTLARYARALSPDAPSPVSKVVPAEDTARLRTWNIRNSQRLVRRCVRAAGLTLDDVDRILLVGGAARPVEVAQAIAELGRPVVMSPDPAHTVAVGAALASAGMADAGGSLGRYGRNVAVLSSAAVVSVLAMSAATMLGGGPIGTDGPALEFVPALAGPAPDPVRILDGTDPGAAGLGSAEVADASLPMRSYSRMSSYSSVPHTVSVSTAEMRHTLSDYDPGSCGPTGGLWPPTYADPAQFSNPLPFEASASIPAISLPPTTSTSGYAATHHISDQFPGPWNPSARIPPPSISKTSPTNSGTTSPGIGSPPPMIGPRVWTGPSNPPAEMRNSTPVLNAGISAQPGPHVPGAIPSGPATNPGIVNSPGDPATTNAGGALSAGGNAASAGLGGNHTASSPIQHTDTAASPETENGPSNSPENVAPQNMSNLSSSATANSPGSETAHSTPNSLGRATFHNSLGGAASRDSLGVATSRNSTSGPTTSKGTSSSAGDATSSSPDSTTAHSHGSLSGTTSRNSSRSLGGTTSTGTANPAGSAHSHSTSSSADGSSFSGGFHAGFSSGGFHGGGGYR